MYDDAYVSHLHEPESFEYLPFLLDDLHIFPNL